MIRAPVERKTRWRYALWLAPVLLLPMLIWWFAYEDAPTATVAETTRPAVVAANSPPLVTPELAVGQGGGVFGAWDRNGDDRLNREEFEFAWTSVGWMEPGIAFVAFNSNRDGAVEEKEFFVQLYK